MSPGNRWQNLRRADERQYGNDRLVIKLGQRVSGGVHSIARAPATSGPATLRRRGIDVPAGGSDDVSARKRNKLTRR